MILPVDSSEQAALSYTWKDLFINETFELSNIQSTTQEKFVSEIRGIKKDKNKINSYSDSAYSHSFTKHTQFDMQMDLLEVHHALSCFPLFKSHCQEQVPPHPHLILCPACLSQLHHFSFSPWYREYLSYLNFLEKNMAKCYVLRTTWQCALKTP